MLIFIPGLVVLFRSNRYLFWGVFVVTSLFIYIMASWWCWYYGGSLGMRPMIDMYAILAIPMVFFVTRLRQIGVACLIVFTGCMIYFNLVLNYQMLHAILHFSEMNKERFFQVFLQTDDRFKFVFFTDNPTLDRKQFLVNQSYTVNNGKWCLAKKPTKNAGSLFPSLVVVPDSALASSSIAVDLSYRFRVNMDEAIPKAILFGYTKGIREEVSIHFMGPQVPSLNQYYPIHAPLASMRTYGEFDSLEVVIEHGESVGTAQFVHCEIGHLKRN